MMNRHLLAAGAAFAFSVGAAATVQAEEMKYTYTGNAFKFKSESELKNPCTPGVAGCGIKSITVEFIHEQFPPNMGSADILSATTFWLISDGLTTVTYDALTTVTKPPGWNMQLFISTDADAVPDKWFIDASVVGLKAGDPTELRTRSSNFPSAGDLTRYCQTDATDATNCFQGTATVLSDPGIWKVGPILPEVIEIDISPWTKRNWIIPWSRGYVAVAVHSTDDFDAQEIDEGTVKFGPAKALVAASYSYDIGRDGDIDALYIFKTRDTGIQCGLKEAMLTGQTLEGTGLAGTELEGVDKIRTILCGFRRWRRR